MSKSSLIESPDSSLKEEKASFCDEDLITLSVLDSGLADEVYKVKHRTRDLVMIKRIIHLEIKPKYAERLLNELSIFSQIDSPYILKFYSACLSQTLLSVCMEYADGGNLDSVLEKVNRIPENILAKVAECVLNALDFLKEKQDQIHREISPSSILVNAKGEFKLSFFDLNQQLNELKKFRGERIRCYLSPERLENLVHVMQSDIWSMGLSLVEMAIGRFPIPVPTENEIKKLISTDFSDCSNIDRGNIKPFSIFEILEYIVHQPSPSLPRSCFSEEFVDFIDICLNKEPSKRQDLKKLLQHKFITKYQQEPKEIVQKWIQEILKRKDA